MLQHNDVWQTIDRLAAKYGLTPSGLARRAGLDPTTFNKSKRVTKEGKKRWPSTESLAKILEATGASLAEFVSLLDHKDPGALDRRIPIVGYSHAGNEGFFDNAGHPAGGQWDEMLFPRLSDSHAFGLKISGDSLEPVYRDGDIIVISPEASLRRGDRVIVKTRDGVIMAKQLLSRSDRQVELAVLNHALPDLVLDSAAIDWIARIVWVSQ